MILSVHALVRSRVQDGLTRAFGLPLADQPPIALSTPPTRALGDLAVPVAFELARRLRKAPRAIAQELAAARRRRSTGVARIDAAPNGYLNLFLDRAGVPPRAARSGGRRAAASDRARGKIIVEHTAINPNKAAHIGHLRNAALGDTLVRAAALPRHAGRSAELHRRHRRSGRRRRRRLHGARGQVRSTQVRALADDPTSRSTTTAGISTRASPSGTTATRRGSTRAPRALHDIEHGGNDTRRDGRAHRRPHRPRHLKTMARLNIDYDLLTWEGDILRLHFWAHGVRRS